MTDLNVPQLVETVKSACPRLPDADHNREARKRVDRAWRLFDRLGLVAKRSVSRPHRRTVRHQALHQLGIVAPRNVARRSAATGEDVTTQLHLQFARLADLINCLLDRITERLEKRGAA